MIDGYNQHGSHVESLEMFSKLLRESQLKPDRYTPASLLFSCTNLEELKFEKQIHANIIKSEYNTFWSVGNALFYMYSKGGSVKIAKKLLEQFGTSILNVIAFTTLLDNYIELGNQNPARQVFDLLKDPNVVSWRAMVVDYVQNGMN
ncbi:unnamed protein product [Fraxinus pennsylvanica]|uniref:Pentatricopeptide repeat-containing protein n=1 Tax=Fraxinus pennsylvanica TaxID=56036 RepID=A0AAD1YVR6_9LAMI|nr:unnamed protein product [Fraxinus pennsylvanica]